jgi:hypothetical protein
MLAWLYFARLETESFTTAATVSHFPAFLSSSAVKIQSLTPSRKSPYPFLFSGECGLIVVIYALAVYYASTGF